MGQAEGEREREGGSGREGVGQGERGWVRERVGGLEVVNREE